MRFPTTYFLTTTTLAASIDDAERLGSFSAFLTHLAQRLSRTLAASGFASMEVGTGNPHFLRTDKHSQPNSMRYFQPASLLQRAIHLFDYASWLNSLAVCSQIQHTMSFTPYAEEIRHDTTCARLHSVAAPSRPLAPSHQSHH